MRASSTIERVLALLHEGRKLEAIRENRRAVGCSLFEAMDAVTNIEEGKDPKAPRTRPEVIARWYRMVGERHDQAIRQFTAFPRRGRPVEEWPTLEMNWPRVLILVELSDHCMLYRYSGDGEFAGDRWSEDADDARRQAEFEYSDSLEGQWKPVPELVLPGQEHLWALRPPS